MKREPPKTDKNRQMLVTMGSTNRKSKVSFSNYAPINVKPAGREAGHRAGI